MQGTPLTFIVTNAIVPRLLTVAFLVFPHNPAIVSP